MEDINKKINWEETRLPYPWYYNKQWYDIKAKDWTILLWVRPNAGKFKQWDVTIMEEDVVKYRLPKWEWLNQ